MPSPLVPHRAAYAFVRADGSEAGTETVGVAASAAGWRIQSRIETSWPEEVVASVDWALDRDLVTRRLRIVNRERFAGESELELTVTGNGLLAHRQASSGPTQVELGWGPNAELDYVSAAFPMVMLARSNLAPGASRDVDAVQVGTTDLFPTIVPMRLRALAEKRVECLVIETGHIAEATLTTEGALAGYAGLLRLVSLDASR